MKTTKHDIKFRLMSKGKELIYLTADIKGDFKKPSSPFTITVCPPTVEQAMESFFRQVIQDPSDAKYLAELEQAIKQDALLAEKVLHLAANSSIDYYHDKNWQGQEEKI